MKFWLSGFDWLLTIHLQSISCPISICPIWKRIYSVFISLLLLMERQVILKYWFNLELYWPLGMIIQSSHVLTYIQHHRIVGIPWGCEGRTLVGRQWSGAEWSRIPASSSGGKWSVGLAMTCPPPRLMTAAGACSHWTTPCHLFSL